jgi:lipopolysaccharide/colanic/teichoic acid biosynthesis glycosyltransferase
MRAVLATVLIVAGASAVGFVVNRLDGIARSLPVLQIVLMAAGLIGVRVLTRIAHERRRPEIRSPIALPTADDTVLVVGWSSLAELFVRSVTEFGGGKIHIAGILSPYVRHVGRLVQSIRVLGSPEEASRIVADLDVHGVHVGRIVVATPFERLSDEARRALREIESTTGIRLEFFAERLGICVTGTPPGERPAEAPPSAPAAHASAFATREAELDRDMSRAYWKIKRLVDVAVALTMIVVLSPLILLTALVVALDVGLPTVFVQQRPGLRGCRFTLYKFRTMGPSHDSDGRRIADEARISRVGLFLRRTRLDELPQLFNILIGEMSFVGPRPLVSREQSMDIVARLLVRPGLTGWAQVHGGRTVSMTDKAALDLWYVRHASLKLDLKIILATLPIVLFGERVDGEVVRLAWRDLHGLEGHGRVGE